jgi:thiol-disulfide isomerase/thioredoxin
MISGDIRAFKILIVLLMLATSILAGKIDDFSLKDLNNKKVSYSEIQGEKLTVLDFWATWCKPCAQAIPHLTELYLNYKDRGVQFIGINVDSPRNISKVRPFANSLGINYPVLLDSNSELMARLQVTTLPTVLFIDPNNEIVYIHRGYRPGDDDIIETEIDKILLQDSDQNEDEK